MNSNDAVPAFFHAVHFCVASDVLKLVLNPERIKAVLYMYVRQLPCASNYMTV